MEVFYALRPPEAGFRILFKVAENGAFAILTQVPAVVELVIAFA
jgi:hypothetical protein